MNKNKQLKKSKQPRGIRLMRIAGNIPFKLIKYVSLNLIQKSKIWVGIYNFFLPLFKIETKWGLKLEHFFYYNWRWGFKLQIL